MEFKTPAVNTYLFEEMDEPQSSGFHKFNDGKGDDEPLRFQDTQLREEMGMTTKSEADASKPTKAVQEENQGPISKSKSMSEKEPTQRSKEMRMSELEEPVRDQKPTKTKQVQMAEQ